MNRKNKSTPYGKSSPYPAAYGKSPKNPKSPKPTAPKPTAPLPTQRPPQPGIRTPTVQPFMNAEDMMNRAAAEATMAEKLQSLDYELGQLSSRTDFEKTEIERDRIRDLADTNDEMAGRGLFQSSIRDADLFDIDATAATRKNFLDRELDAATLNTQNQKVIASQAWDSFQEALNNKMIENAREAQEGMPDWLKEPVAGGTIKANVNTNQANQARFLEQWQNYLDELAKWKNRKRKKKGKKGKKGKSKPGTTTGTVYG